MPSMSRRHLLISAGAATLAAPFVNVKYACAAEFTYKYANNVAADHPLTVWAGKAAQEIREKTGGRLEINVFPNNQLGADPDMLSQLRSGALEFFTMSGLVLSTLVPVASINGIGFAFPDYDDVWKAMDGTLGAHIRAAIQKANLVVFDKIWNGGYRQITSSSRVIRTPDDLRGFKIRVPVSPLWTSMFKALGASPASINFSEVYTSMQTKIVDGQETPLASIEAAKLYEVQKYCALTNHMWDGFWFLANLRAFERLPADLRETVSNVLNTTAIAQRGDVTTRNRTLQGTLEKQGLQFNQPDRAQFADLLRKSGFYREWQGRYGPEAWGLLEQAVGKLA